MGRMKLKDETRKQTIQGVIATMVIVGIGSAVFISSCTNPGGRLPPLKSIKEQFEQGKYSYSAPGVVVLSPSDRHLSCDGMFYVTGNPPSLILFPKWRDEAMSIVATGWSSTALREGAIVAAQVPFGGGGVDKARESAVPPTGVRKLRVAKDLGDNWYVFEGSAG